MHKGLSMKKNMSLFMVLSIYTGLFGADTSCSTQSYPDGRYNVETEFEVAEDMVKIGMAHLPGRVRSYVNAIATGHIKSGVVLFEGPPGAAKTTTAKCIGQQYYNKTPAFPGELRSHVFHGSMLTGDQYQNSGVTVLRTNIEPIIARAKDAPQFIVFDEFQKLVKKSDNNSSERESAASQILKLFDAMDKTNNIIFIGTCNKTKGIPGPIMSRFSDLFKFGEPSVALSAAVLEHYLLKADIPTTVTTAAELDKVAKNFKEGVRQVKHIVNRAKVCVLDRKTDRGVISCQDLIDAINEYNKEFGPKKITWEKFFKKHQHKIIVAATICTVTMAGVGLYLHIKNMNLQEAHRVGDLARQARERAEDVATAAARHDEVLAQAAKSAADQMTQVAEQEAARLRHAADFNGLVPPFLRSEFNTLSPEEQAKCLIERRKRIEGQYGTIGVLGDVASDYVYKQVGGWING